MVVVTNLDSFERASRKFMVVSFPQVCMYDGLLMLIVPKVGLQVSFVSLIL